MDYFLITEQNIQKRYYSLPKKLKDVLDSEKNAELVNRVCNNHYLKDEDKIIVVEQLVALVILGFIELQELKKEVSENLNLNVQHSADIISELNKIIFEPIKVDIEKNYKPVAPEPIPTRQPMVEVKPAESSSFAKAMEDKQKPFSPLDVLKEAPISSKPPAEIPVSKPITPFVPVPSAPKPPIQPLATKAEGLPSEVLTKEGPLIIHKEAELKPLSETKKSLGGFFNFLNRDAVKKKDTLSPVKAKVEIGSSFAKAMEDKSFFAKSSAEAKTLADKSENKPSYVKATEDKPVEAPKIKVVHYTDFQAPLPKDPFSFNKPQPSLKDLSKPVPPSVPVAPVPPVVPPVMPKPTIESKYSFAPKPPVTPPSFNMPTAPSAPANLPSSPVPPPIRIIPPVLSSAAPVNPSYSPVAPRSVTLGPNGGGDQAANPEIKKPETQKEETPNVIDLRSFK